jgi:hypothetical protein
MHATLIVGQSPIMAYRQAFSSPVSLFLASIAYVADLACCPAVYAAIKWAEYSFSIGEVGLPGIPRTPVSLALGISLV